MSKTRDNSPELDYFELRRRHEEYKRARSAPQPEKNPVEERLERQVAQQKAKPEPAVVVEETPINDVQDTLDVETKAAPADAFEEAIEENYEAYEDDMDYDEEADEEAVNPNPFDSFIRFFNGMKSNRASRRQKDDDLEDLDLEDLTDEELAELEDEYLEGLDEDFEDEPAPVKPRFSLRRNARSDVEEDEEEFTPAEDIEDLDDAPRPARKAASRFADEDEDFDDDDFEGLDDEDFDDEDFDDEDFDDEDFDDEDDAPRKGGFKKFVNLFVTRVDEDEEDEDFDEDDFEEDELEDADFEDEDLDEIEEDEEEPVRRGFFSRGRKNKARHTEEDEEIYDDFPAEIQIRPEGGQRKMDEMNKLAPETTAQADVIETSGMSRRERRERAMRLAAEEAARKAEEEALAKAEAAPVEPLFTDLEVKQDSVDMAAFEGAPETDLIVETTAEEVLETVDEPTREFTPVSMRDVQDAAEKALFDTDDEDEDFDDEDDEDEEEIIEKKPRRSLFGRKRAKDEDEDDDFDDEDEDDEDDDDDEYDEEEIVEKKPRRGLFGRKRAKDEDEDDDEDEEDLDDSYDDEDEDDEYDEYDDDEDDYDEDDDDDEYDDDDYDDDDDEPRRSFGHHLIGVFKIILGLILVLLVLVIGLNFHYFVIGENAILEKTHEMLGDSSASDVLCFGYVMRETMPAVETAPEVVPEVETEVEPTALPQAEVAIPDLNNNGAITETPVVEAAPVIEAAPAVAEAPVNSGSIG